MTSVGQPRQPSCRCRGRRLRALPRVLGSVAVGARAAVGASRPSWCWPAHADRADPRRRRQRCSLINALTVLAAARLIGREVWQRGAGAPARPGGARLHVRIVALFSLIAAVPAILVAVVASVTLDRGLDRWFSIRTQAIIENVAVVAEAYVQEHAADRSAATLIAMAHRRSRAPSRCSISDRDRLPAIPDRAGDGARACRPR